MSFDARFSYKEHIDRFSLKGKFAVVTGAARGIGRGIALEFANAGADLVVSDILDDINLTCEEVRAMGRRCYAVKADVTKEEEVQHIFDVCIQEFGRLDILAHASGIIFSANVADMPVDKWKNIIDVNLNGTLYATKAAVRLMIPNKYGKIILMDSCASKTGEPGNSAYSATKGGVHMLGNVLSYEVAQYNINVNTIAPGTIRTPMIEEVIHSRAKLQGVTPEEWAANFNEMTPLKRMGEPWEVGALAVFLASDASAFITGCSVNIAGGREVH